jgi:hypothetical protein
MSERLLARSLRSLGHNDDDIEAATDKLADRLIQQARDEAIDYPAERADEGSTSCGS